MNDLTKAIEINGVFARRPIRELEEFRELTGDKIVRPTVYVDGVAVVSFLYRKPVSELQVTVYYVLLFLEFESDVFYFFEPPQDSVFRLKEFVGEV